MEPEYNYSKHAIELHLEYLRYNRVRGECLEHNQTAVLKLSKPQKLISSVLASKSPWSSTINTLKLKWEYIAAKEQKNRPLQKGNQLWKQQR